MGTLHNNATLKQKMLILARFPQNTEKYCQMAIFETKVEISEHACSSPDCNGTPVEQGSEKDPISSMQDHDLPTDGQMLLEPAVKDLEEAVTAYLRRATETFDLSKNVEVCSY